MDVHTCTHDRHVMCVCVCVCEREKFIDNKQVPEVGSVQHERERERERERESSIKKK